MAIPHDFAVKRLALIANLTAGRRDKRAVTHAIMERVRAMGVDVTLYPTQFAGHAGILTKEAVENGMDAIAVFGGDGSIREVGEALAGSETPLVILPAGTSNVVARSLDIPLDPLAAVERLATGTITAVDGGQANDAFFLFMCGAGMDAEVMAGASIPFKKILGRASFYPTALRIFLTYRFPAIRMDVDGKEYEGTYAAVTNIPHFAGPYLLCPPAQWDDGLLDGMMLKVRGRIHLLKLFWKLKRGRHMDDPAVTHVTGRNFTLSCTRPLRYQLDGDTMGSLPVTVTVKPGALKVLL